MNKTTVLMSTYNGEKYIREQIDTILAQDIDGLKLLVRDDGSSDMTHQILDEYAMRGALEWFKGENVNIQFDNTLSKIGFSFLQLVKRAPESEYYAFADQDDIWLPNKLSEGIKFLESNTNSTVPLLYCSAYTCVDADGADLHIKPRKVHKKSGQINRLLIDNIATGCTCIFNKGARDLFAKYAQPEVCIHDFTLAKIVSTFGRVVHDKRSFIKYRQHGKNIVGGQKFNLFARIKKFKKNSKNMRSRSAASILAEYGDIMSPKTKALFQTLATYRKSFKKKCSLLFTNKIRPNGHVENLLFKFAVFLNKV
jgi:rhamnosyltransferase